MKILFNCTTNVVGGGVKNSAIFIKYARNYETIDWLFAVSIAVKDILDRWGICDERIHLFTSSPAKNRIARKDLLEIVKQRQVKLVFTMAGPAYINFKIPHVMGVSNPYITHAGFQDFIRGKGLVDIFKMMLHVGYQTYYARRADYWVFQTDVARETFSKRVLVNCDKSSVIANSIGDEFGKYFNSKPIHNISQDKTIIIFCPAADYPHKAVHLVPQIAYELKKLSDLSYDFKFIFTLRPDSDLWKMIASDTQRFGLKNQLENIGPYNYVDAISLFAAADIVFVPSLLETFSASYLEAFASKRTLIVSDKKFAHDICQNAALYINPVNAKETASVINNLICNYELQKKLIENGQAMLERFGTQRARVNKIVSLLQNFVNC